MQNTTSRNIIGPDLNEYRGDVNYTLLATQTPYCYLRGSGYGTGRFRIDRRFIEYVNGLKNVGIKTGAYHYAVPSSDLSTADSQCDGFIDVLQQAYGPGRYGDLFPVIDIEAPLDKSISTDTLLDWVDRFRKRFERKTRRKMMLYTGSFFIELYNNFYHTKKGFILADMPLWIAMYPEIQPNPDYPRDQGGWTRWRMWQFTENGTMPGVNPPVDLNYGPENLDLLMQPRNVRNFRAVPIGQEIRLTWTPNTDIDLGGYNIFINSNYVTTLGKGANSYILKLANRPSMGEKYIMSIEAFDTDGDFSQERASANVTFGRDIIEVNNEAENLLDGERITWNRDTTEVNDEVLEDYKYTDIWSMDTEIEQTTQSNINIQPRVVEFNDPVDNLEKRFIKSAQRNENANINLYDDFVEADDEFDDILYMKRLEAETAYKSYYGNREAKDKLGLYEIGEEFRDKNSNKGLKGKTSYPCEKCIKHHDEHEQHNHGHCNDKHNYHEDHSDYNDKDHEHYMELEFNKYPWKKHDKGKDYHMDEYDDKEHDYKPDWMKEWDNKQKGMEEHDYKPDWMKKWDNKQKGMEEHDYKPGWMKEWDNKQKGMEEYDHKPGWMKEWDDKSLKCKCNREEENEDIALKEENQDIALKEDHDITLEKQNSEDSKRYEYKPSYDEILRERYEGDRRRLENRDPIKHHICDECVKPKSNCMKCEYLLHDMYLNNCDYGHKHHKKKHYDYKECNECHTSKKKKKKHHKKHHR